MDQVVMQCGDKFKISLGSVHTPFPWFSVAFLWEDTTTPKSNPQAGTESKITSLLYTRYMEDCERFTWIKVE